MIVKNTGNVPIKFGALKDTNCEGITPAGATELAVGAEESFTCSHVLAVGTYTNEASIEGNEGTGTKTSNKVTTKVPAEPSFTIEKLQRIAGEGTYGAGELTGKLGQTAEYKIVVKNTGNVTLKFGALKDTGCEGITPPGATELAVGEEEAFTCTHVLAVGTTTNEASIEGNEGTGKQTSNKVTIKVAAEPSFTIEKQQKIKGEGTFGTGELTGKLGQTVEYKIVVKNTGNVPIKFGALKDTGCEGITPAGATELAVGKEESFTCTHVLAVGTYTNEASIEGNEGTGTKTSNKVTAKVAAEPNFTIEKLQRIKGEANYVAGELTGALGQTARIQDRRQEHRQRAAQIRRPQRHRLRRHHARRRHRTRRRQRRVLHVHPRLGRRHHNQRSLDRRQRRHRHQDLQQSHHQSAPPNRPSRSKSSSGSPAKAPTSPLPRPANSARRSNTRWSSRTPATCRSNSAPSKTPAAKASPRPAPPNSLSGAEESFTCTHVLAVGTTINEASIEGNEGTGTETSNKVTTTVAAEPTFTIEKFQRIKGEPTYTTSEVTGALGQIVEYKIVVTNTGNVTLKFGALKDTNCEGITPSGATELAVGKAGTFTCTHTLSAVGPYTNEASIEGNEGTGTKTSNKVTAKVPAEPSFSIEKLQKIAGEGTFGASELTGKLGQTVEYKIVVKNTGNVTLKFGALKDTGCEGITPSGATELAAGKEESFTCTHVLAVGTYSNEASIEGNEGTGTKTSNKVSAKVAAEPSYIDREAAADRRRRHLQLR